MTSRDLGSVDEQLDALDPGGLYAARAAALIPPGPRRTLEEVDAALAELGEPGAGVMGVTAVTAAATRPSAATRPAASAAAPAPTPAVAESAFQGLPPDADLTLVPGTMTVADMTAAANSATAAPAKPETRSPWSKKADPIPAGSGARLDDGVDTDLDFDDLFDDLIAPTAPVVIDTPPPAHATPIDEDDLDIVFDD